jgi:hypothetical protein
MRKLFDDSMNCYPRNCPAIFEMDDGRLMVVGTDLGDAPPPGKRGAGREAGGHPSRRVGVGRPQPAAS